MKIVTLWGERKGYEGEVPELMVAWDEFGIDNNPDGFEKECQQAVASWGSDLVQWRRIEIEVASAPIFKAFEPIEVKGQVAA